MDRYRSRGAHDHRGRDRDHGRVAKAATYAPAGIRAGEPLARPALLVGRHVLAGHWRPDAARRAAVTRRHALVGRSLVEAPTTGLTLATPRCPCARIATSRASGRRRRRRALPQGSPAPCRAVEASRSSRRARAAAWHPAI